MWELIRRWWHPSGSKTGNCADVFTLCLFFLAFTELVSSPLCSSLSITPWHLPAAKAHTHILGLGLWLWLEYGAGFCYEMYHENCWKLRWKSWNIPCDPIDATNKQNHKSLFLNLKHYKVLSWWKPKASQLRHSNDEKNMKWPQQHSPLWMYLGGGID